MENKLPNLCSLMSVDAQKQDHPLMPECSYQNTINVLITKKCLSLESVSAKVLLRVLQSTASPPPPQPTPCFPPPPPFPITPHKFLPEIPFHINQWRSQNQGTPLQQDLLRARLRLLFIFFLFIPFFPKSFLLCSVWCNCSDFLLFPLSLSPSSLNITLHPWGISWIS